MADDRQDQNADVEQVHAGMLPQYSDSQIVAEVKDRLPKSRFRKYTEDALAQQQPWQRARLVLAWLSLIYLPYLVYWIVTGPTVLRWASLTLIDASTEDGKGYYPILYVHGVVLAVFLGNLFVFWFFPEIIRPRSVRLLSKGTQFQDWMKRRPKKLLRWIGWAYAGAIFLTEFLTNRLGDESLVGLVMQGLNIDAQVYPGTSFMILLFLPSAFIGFATDSWRPFCVITWIGAVLEGILIFSPPPAHTISRNLQDFARENEWAYLVFGCIAGFLVLSAIFRTTLSIAFRFPIVVWVMVLAHIFWWVTPKASSDNASDVVGVLIR